MWLLQLCTKPCYIWKRHNLLSWRIDSTWFQELQASRDLCVGSVTCISFFSIWIKRPSSWFIDPSGLWTQRWSRFLIITFESGGLMNSRGPSFLTSRPLNSAASYTGSTPAMGSTAAHTYTHSAIGIPLTPWAASFLSSCASLKQGSF